MPYFLFGPDTYRSREKLKELIKKYQANFEVQKIDGENVKAGVLRSKIMSASLLSAKRLFVIENLSKNEEQKEITDFLKEGKMSENDFFIFFEEEVDKKTSLYKFLSRRDRSRPILQGSGPIQNKTDESRPIPATQVFEFDFLKGAELKKWVRNYVKNKKGKIEEAALEELLMNNNNLWLLSREIDKFLAYHKHITLENVRQLSPVNFDDKIFNLTDAIGSGDKILALNLLNQWLSSGAEPLYLLSMIARQFRILIQVKEAGEKERFPNYNFIAQELGLHHFVVQKSLAQSQKYSFDNLEKIYRGLEEVDLKLKSSKLTAEHLLNLFVIKLE